MMPGNLTVRPVLHSLALEVMAVNRFEIQCTAKDIPVVAGNHARE
jgi:hypothetical protein